jgi:hypothetical protein
MRSVYFMTAVGLLLCVLGSLVGYYYSRRRPPTQLDWEKLFVRLGRIDSNNIARVALEVADGSGLSREVDDGARLEPAQIWQLVGGLEGLEVLEANSEVLIDLACYVQQQYPEALATAEQLRLDARKLKWHVARLKGAAGTGNLEVSFPFYAQRSVAIYYLMTRRVLNLYEAGRFVMLADLQKAL